jgi:hypothetical protein
MEPTEGSETSAFKIQTPGKYPKEYIPHLQHGESLKTKILHPFNTSALGRSSERVTVVVVGGDQGPEPRLRLHCSH